jgi:type II secretory pathway pseudopilin PulG
MNEAVKSERSAEAGFTLVEAIVAVLVLVVGLAAVSNLLIVASSNNTAAGKATGTAVAASEALEELKRRPIGTLVVGGSLTANQNGYFAGRASQGVGTIITRWTIAAPPVPPPPPQVAVVITVQSRDQSPITGFVRSESVFTTLRTN